MSGDYPRPPLRREYARNTALVTFGLAAFLLLSPSGRTDDFGGEEPARRWCAPTVFEISSGEDEDCVSDARSRVGWSLLFLVFAAPAAVVYLDARPDE